MSESLHAVEREDGASVALGDGPHIRTLEAWAHWLCEHLDGASVRDGALRAARMDVVERGAALLRVVHTAMEDGEDGFALLGRAVAAGSPEWSDLDGWLAGLSDDAVNDPTEPVASVPVDASTTPDPVNEEPDEAASAADAAASSVSEGLAPIAAPFGYSPELPAADEPGTFDVMVIDVGDDPDRTASILRAGAGDVWTEDAPLIPGAVIAEDVAAPTVRRLHTLLATPAAARIVVRDR